MVCSECRRESLGKARGWRAYLTPTDDLTLYCLRCGLRQFGPLRRRSLDDWYEHDPRDSPEWEQPDTA